MYPSADYQTYQNAQYYAQGLATNVSNSFKRKPTITDPPALIWDKNYETTSGKAKFLRVIQELSDYMLFNKSGLWNHENINGQYLIDAVKGKLNATDYYTAEYTFGDKSNTPIRDNHFYYASKSSLSGQVSSQPFQFSCKNVSNELTDKQIRKAADKAAKMATNLLAEYAAASGQDLSFIEDQKINMSGTKDEILAQLKDTEKLEYIIYKLVQDINYRHDIRTIEKKCFESKFDINAEFAFIDIINGDVRPKALRPEQVLWISGKPIESLEDDSVVAASVIDYLTVTEILHKYAFKLNTGTGAAGLYDAVDKLRKGCFDQYNPNQHYFTEYLNATLTTSDPRYYAPKENLPVLAEYNYNSSFYPYTRTGRGLSYTMLEQKMFFKMIVPKRYVVEINGSRPTDRQYQEWLKSDYNRKLNATFTEVDDDEKVKGKYLVENKPKIELWQADRLGHGTLINVGRYEYTTSIKGRNSYVGMPIVAQISYDKSFGYIGYNFALWTNILFNRIEEIIAATGFSTAILIDEAIETDVTRFMYHAKKSGVALYNSSKFIGGNQSQLKHLDIMKLGNHVEEVNQMLSMIGTMKILFENMIGASPQVQGIQQDYSGAKETQINIQNQSQLAQPKFYEHQLFMNQVLQRTADIAKKLFSRDEYINVRVSEDAHEVLKLTKDLDSADPDIKLVSGMDLKNKKAVIDQIVSQVMASGGIEMIEPLIEITLTDNPMEALSIFRANKKVMLEVQAQAQQAQAQMAQQQAQIDQQKIQVPIEVKKIDQQTQFGVQQMKSQERADSEDLKGHLTDVKHYQGQENELLKSDLRKEEQGESSQNAFENEANLRAIDEMMGVQQSQPA